jgi:hypothetical protein
MSGEWGFWEDEDEDVAPVAPAVTPARTFTYMDALMVTIDVEHPLRKQFPILDELPDSDAIARFLFALDLGHFDLALGA